MKQLDKLILQLFIRYFSFALPFVLLLLTMQRLISYFPRFVGKGLGAFVLVKLFGYLMINALFFGMPLAIMLASLMTYGNLGEHSELTAIKAAGISLLRLLRPTFLLTLGFVGINILLNLYFTPHMNLKLFTLLHDIKHKKPSFQLEEKEFHSGIPGYTIRVGKKFPDDRTFKHVMIYDHSTPKHRIILADSCLMYTENKGQHLLLELFKGHYYVEQRTTGQMNTWDPLIRTQFKKMDLRFSLSSFDFKRSQESSFSHVRFTKSVPELLLRTQELRTKITGIEKNAIHELLRIYALQPRTKKKKSTDTLFTDTPSRNMPSRAKAFHMPSLSDSRARLVDDFASKGLSLDSIRQTQAALKEVKGGKEGKDNLDTSPVAQAFQRLKDQVMTSAMRKKILENIQELQASVSYHAGRIKNTYKSLYRYEIEAYRRYAFAFSCLSMYLIGAPLGTIIKRGGLGFPLIISTLFCIKFYVLNSLFEKYAREGLMSTYFAAWLPNLLLVTIGFFFLWLALKDSQILEWDRYRIFFQRLLKKNPKNEGI